MPNNVIEVIAKFINEASAGLATLGEDVDKTTEKQDKSKESSDNWTESLLKNAIAGVTVGAVFSAVASGIKATIDAYGEAEVVSAQLDAVLQSTGGAAGMTREELDSLADSLSKMSGVDDEVIAKNEAVLLTFTKVGKDVFPQATEAALNMSAALGQDLQASMIQVGKALNEPIQGATALRRVGVQLTDQQEDQIKAFMAVNDIASAQSVILNELAVEFGGVAEGMGNTTVGATNKLKTAWGNLLETMGEGNANQFRQGTEDLTQLVEAQTTFTKASNLAEEAIARGILTEGEWNRMQLEAIFTGKTYEDVLREIELRMATGTEGIEEYRRGEWGLIEATNEATKSMDEYIPKFDQLLSLSARISSETENYNEKQADLIGKQAEIKAQIDELIRLGWTPMSEKVQDLQQKYDELGTKSQEMAEKHAEAMGKMQYDLLLTKLSADGLDAAEYDVMQQAGLMFGVFDQESVDAARNMDQVTKAVQEGKLRVQDMQAALDLMSKGKYTVDVVMNILQSNAGSLGTFKTGHEAETASGGGYAEGGISTGSESGHAELLHGTEAVIPLQNGAVPVQIFGSGAPSGGNNYYISLTIASPITIMDEQNTQAVLLPLIEDGVRQLQAQGALSND
jgi:hypothetical protein